jgi:hypothetical protein
MIPWAMNKQLLRVSQNGILPEETRLRPKTSVLSDPLVLQVVSRKWDPIPSSPTSAALDSIIDLQKLLRSIAHAADLSLYTHLRPVAVSRWLIAVETDNGIKYSRLRNQFV